MSARWRGTSMNGAASHNKKSVDCEAALAALPHADPFRFVTRVTAIEPGRANGVWVVRGDEDFFQGHFPNNPIVPGVLIGEALAQISGIICGVTNANGRPFEGRLAQIDVKFLLAVIPPAEIELKSELTRSLEPLHQFAVEARVHETIVARGTVTLALESQPVEPKALH